MKCTCLICGREFEDVNYSEETKSIKRIYCNDCVNDLLEKNKLKEV